jgi:hypothetical protein
MLVYTVVMTLINDEARKHSSHYMRIIIFYKGIIGKQTDNSLNVLIIALPYFIPWLCWDNEGLEAVRCLRWAV